MGKKAFMAGIILFLTAVLIISAAYEDALANPINYGPPRITILSPQNGYTYNSSQVTLLAEVQLFGYTYSSLEVISWARYAVDNGVTYALNLNMPTVIAPGTVINLANTLSSLSDGNHTVNIFLETSFGESANANVSFTIDTTKSTPSPTPTPTPSSSPTLLMSASLAESASALNFGNKINFTVSVVGGTAPYSYAWYLDNQLVDTTSSPYYSTDKATVGSHHIYVEVTDAHNNTAKTLAPEFNVLPSQNYSPTNSPYSSPTQQPTITPSTIPTSSLNHMPTPSFTPSTSTIFVDIIDYGTNPLPYLVGIIIIVAAVIVGVLVFIKKVKK